MIDFETAAERHRRELHLHCYRMLASYDEADDAVQDSYLKAWRNQDQFDGTNLRAWLYKVATNVCLDRIRSRQRRVSILHSAAEVPWLTPYPDTVLDGPDVTYVERETIELAFLVALQVLPPRQRAALLAREVLGLTAAETADLLGTSVAATNSALQRAREAMKKHLPSHRSDWSARPPSPGAARAVHRCGDGSVMSRWPSAERLRRPDVADVADVFHGTVDGVRRSRGSADVFHGTVNGVRTSAFGRALPDACTILPMLASPGRPV